MILVAVASAAAVIAVHAATGSDASIVESDSMRPALRRGDIILSRSQSSDPFRPGTVIRFDQGGGPVVHRIVRVNDDGTYVTRGDAVGRDDTDAVDPDQIIGRPHTAIPWLGLPVLWIREGELLDAVLAVAVALGATECSRWGLARRFDPWYAGDVVSS